jgi:hypothetical protein
MNIAAALAIALTCLLCACQTGPPDAKDLDAELHKIAQSGYQPEHHHSVRTARELWRVGEADWEVSLAVPDTKPGTRSPVVVYFPGLGESADAGALWRRSWAEAGYLVISVQPISVGSAIWSSSRAQAGDFHGIAAEQFSLQAAQARATELAQLVDELAVRSTAKGSDYATADLTRVALAGYDLGAQTASLLSGERPRTSAGRAPLIGAQALITISPFHRETIEAAALSTFDAMTRPVLAISATDDGDPYTLISRPDLRQIPWNSMPAPLKCLLILDGASHRLLAGNALMDPESPGIPQTSTATGSGKQGRKRRSGGESLDALQWNGDGDTSADPVTPVKGRRQNPVPAGPRVYNLRTLAAIQNVSTAFLDMVVRQRQQARQWLQQAASVWPGTTARLTLIGP